MKLLSCRISHTVLAVRVKVEVEAEDVFSASIGKPGCSCR